MAFRGLVAPLPVGLEGLTGTKNVSRVRRTQLLQAEGITYESGNLEKEGGADKYNSTAITGTPSILAGHDWDHDGATQRMVVFTSAGTLLKDSGSGAFATTLDSGLSVSSPCTPVFVEGGKEAAANNRKLFFFSENNQVQVLSADGATTSNLATPPADWSGSNQPTVGFLHKDRLWGCGNPNDRHRLYYSTLTDHEDFTGAGAGTLSVFPGDGQGIVAAVSFRGVIVVFKKPRGIYVVDTRPTDVADWSVSKLNGNLGVACAGVVTPALDDIIFIDTGGDIRALSATDTFGDVGTDSLSDPMDMDPFIRERLDLTQMRRWRMQYYSTKREVHIACTTVGETTNDARLVMDFNLTGIVRFRFSQRDTPVSMWSRERDGRPELMMGEDNGFIWRLDQSAKSKDGVGYASIFQSPEDDLSSLDPSLATVRKEGKFLELVVEPRGNWNLTVEIIWDGSEHETVFFNMGVAGGALGSFLLGTDILAGAQVLSRKRRITGGGRRFSLRGSNDGANQDFSAARFFLHFKPGNERITV